MIAPRIDSEGQYNLMIARSVSKNDSVFAFTFVDNNQNLRSAVVKLNQNCSNPEPVAVQGAMLEGLSTAKITWKAPLLNSENIKGYNVYRNGEKVNASLLTTAEYYDADLAVGAYQYYVTAEYNDGQVSAASTSVTVNVEADEANAPYALSARMKMQRMCFSHGTVLRAIFLQNSIMLLKTKLADLAAAATRSSQLYATASLKCRCIKAIRFLL